MSKATVKKSNHKHKYKQCLLRFSGGYESIAIGKRCSICGRTKMTDLFVTEPVPSENVLRLLHNDEVLEKYKELSIYNYDWDTKYT